MDYNISTMLLALYIIQHHTLIDYKWVWDTCKYLCMHVHQNNTIVQLSSFLRLDAATAAPSFIAYTFDT